MKNSVWILAIILVFLFGCAEIQPPNPIEIIKHPWGTNPDIKIGMTKEEVVKYWDQPDQVEQLGTDRWGVTKEKWTYFGRYPDVPLDYKYLSITKVLYFDGNRLTSVDSEKNKSREISTSK